MGAGADMNSGAVMRRFLLATLLALFCAPSEALTWDTTSSWNGVSFLFFRAITSPTTFYGVGQDFVAPSGSWALDTVTLQLKPVAAGITAQVALALFPGDGNPPSPVLALGTSATVLSTGAFSPTTFAFLSPVTLTPGANYIVYLEVSAPFNIDLDVGQLNTGIDPVSGGVAHFYDATICKIIQR
jgi:hypothetical protein